MKIFSINNSNFNQGFKGKYVSIRHGGDLKQFPEWHKNSYAETTLGAYHEDQKNRVYFASPMEPISDNIKENADKIIYDNEPSYPDVNKEVSRNYFGTERKNYKDDFEEIRKYYYRREMGGFASVEEAKYQQWQAAECARLYDKGGHLRYVKEQAEDNIKSFENEKAEITKGLDSAKAELKGLEDISVRLEKHHQNLKEMKKFHSELLAETEKGNVNETMLYVDAKSGKEALESKIASKRKHETFLDDVKSVYSDIRDGWQEEYRIVGTRENTKKDLEKLQATQDKFEAIKEKCNETIKMLNATIEKLQANINTKDKQIAEKKSLIEDCKAKLIPIFDELKNFYAKQGIKVIKKV